MLAGIAGTERVERLALVGERIETVGVVIIAVGDSVVILTKDALIAVAVGERRRIGELATLKKNLIGIRRRESVVL